MNTLRIWAVCRKEFIHIIRDPRSFVMSIAIPMLLLLLFGYALTLDVKGVSMTVWDQDGSQASREFVSRFTGSPYFSLQEYVRDYRELENAVDSGKSLVALVIPAGSAGRIESGREAPVQLIVDGSDSNTATIAMGYADVIAMIYSQDVALKEIQHLVLKVREQVWAAHLKFKESYEATQASEAIVRSARESMRMTRERYEAGVATATDLLDTQTTLARAEYLRANSRWDYFLARSAYKRTIGVILDEVN